MTRIFSFFFLCFLTACSTAPVVDSDKAPLVLSPVGYNSLPGWAQDNHANGLIAFKKSCARILKNDPDKKFGPDGIGGVYGDWHPACKTVNHVDPLHAKNFFEHYFSPWQAFAGYQKTGLFTGYYEAALQGSKTQHGEYQYPVRRRPDDLVMVDLGIFRDELKGQRIAGRVKGAYLKPYENRSEIQGGGLQDDKGLALVWVNNPVDAFFLHIQGSGRVDLDDGGHLRLGYDGQNGHPYYAIGRELIHRGYLEKEQVSMQAIRAWLEANPDEAVDVMNTNKSYVFFHEVTGEGPLGGEGVALTPGRSLAVDRTKIPYGVPVFVDLDPPHENQPSIKRLMVAQDTGGAIRGAVRGDVFWGAGERAEYLAGHMKSDGRYWLLLPNKMKKETRLSWAAKN